MILLTLLLIPGSASANPDQFNITALTAPSWYGFVYSSPIHLTNYSINSSVNLPPNQTWTLYGTSDGKTFIVLDKQDGVSFTKDVPVNFTICCDPAMYSYYYINFEHGFVGSTPDIGIIFYYPTAGGSTCGGYVILYPISDTDVYRRNDWGEDWPSMRDGVGTGMELDTDSQLVPRIYADYSPADYYIYLARSELIFRTTSLPDCVIHGITAANISLVAFYKWNDFGGTPSVVFTDVAPLDWDSISIGDYELFGSVDLSNRMLLSDITPPPGLQILNFTLNAAGRNWITNDHNTTFMFRLSPDVDDAPPVWGSLDVMAVGVYSNNTGGPIQFSPRLYIWFSGCPCPHAVQFARIESPNRNRYLWAMVVFVLCSSFIAAGAYWRERKKKEED